MPLDGTNFPTALKDLLTAKQGYKSYPALHIQLGGGSTLYYSTLNTSFESHNVCQPPADSRLIAAVHDSLS
jgi:hypothetical protein